MYTVSLRLGHESQRATRHSLLTTSSQQRVVGPDDVVKNLGRNRRRRADGGQPEPPVGVLAYWIVDPTDDFGHLEHQPGHLGRHDVPVIAVGDGDEGSGLLDPGNPQHILVDAGPNYRVAFEIAWQAAKGP